MTEPSVGTAKALASPVRQRILRELRTLGEATSTTLAERLGVTTGSTSYHLRVLAKHQLVTEIPERAHGRERWWRLGQPRTALETLHEQWFAEDLDCLARFQAQRSELGPWANALPYSRGSMRVTLTELESFFEDYLELLQRYQRPENQTPPDARTVRTRFIAFPDPGRQ